MWWAVITLCTIGYGDMTPVTDTGRLFGSMACVAGVVMVALPISVISSTFQEKYAEHMEKQKIEEARHLREKESYKKALPTWRLLFKMRGVGSMRNLVPSRSLSNQSISLSSSQ
mmetsp:Transcript_10367/g.34575  ORF Transcript_10367/g.34575 Transcript_10367/m.34575 type:complete len:114 (+) Transcript_10367:159-500(+)